MKKMTRLTALLLSAVMLLTSFAAAIEVVDPTPERYIADYANVLTDETKSYIVSKSTELKEETGGEIVVVTIEFLGGQNIEEYARTVMNEWQIGSAELNNGLLLLLVTGEANYCATQGAGIELSLTKQLLGEYTTNYLEPQFAQSNYDQGVLDVYDAFLGWYDRFYNVNVSGGNAAADSLLDSTTPEDGAATDAPAVDNPLDDPLEGDSGLIEKGNIIGKIAGYFLIGVAVLAVLGVCLVAVPRAINLKKRGYRVNVLSRAFWSRTPLPPPRRTSRPTASNGESAPRPQMGMGGTPRSSTPRPSAPRPTGRSSMNSSRSDRNAPRK